MINNIVSGRSAAGSCGRYRCQWLASAESLMTISDTVYHNSLGRMCSSNCCLASLQLARELYGCCLMRHLAVRYAAGATL